MTYSSRITQWSAAALATLLPAFTSAQQDSLADIRSAPAAIRATLNRHLFDPQVLESPAGIATLRAVDSLARSVRSRREFFAGFNRLWAEGPISHVRVGRAVMPAAEMMAFVDTMRAGADGVALRWDGNIAVLEVRTMNGVDTRERISSAYAEIVARGAQGLVIDLRANEGGAFAVVPLVGHLIDRPVEGGVFLGRRWTDQHSDAPSPAQVEALQPWTGWSLTRFWGDVESRGILRIQFTPMLPRYAGPVAVLTSKTTASASELATDAMMNNGRVQVFGERTAGQLLSQRVFDLFPGTHLYVPIADYRSARMGRIEGLGITPHVALPAAQALDSALARLRGSPRPVSAVEPPRLHRAVSTAQSFDANAWWIETADGLVLIDALMLRSDARALATVLKATGKPLRGVIITHGHADHFGGLSVLRAEFPGVPVIATQATATGMREVHDQGLLPNGWLRAFGSEYDTALVAPDRIVASGDTLSLAGLTMVIRDYGPVESANNSVVWVPQLNALFTGDATVHGASFYVGAGSARHPLAALPRILADHPGEVTAYAGHYGPRLLEHTIADNLRQVQQMLAAAALVGGDPANRTLSGDFTMPAKRQLLLLLALQTAERGDYGIGALGMARFELPALISTVIADSARRTSVQTRAVRDGIRPLLFLVGHYANAKFTLGLGGLYVDAEVAAPSGHRYQLMFSYDHVQARYRVVSRDQISGLLDVFEGTREAGGSLLVSNVGPGTHYLDASGAKAFNRMRFIPREDGSWLWRVETGTGDGSWSQLLEQEMRRLPMR